MIVEQFGNTSFCCLGVLCDLHNKAGQTGRWYGADYVTPDAEDGADSYASSMPPKTVREWFGIPSAKGAWQLPIEDREGNHCGLAELNDDFGFTFSQIADLIEHVM